MRTPMTYGKYNNDEFIKCLRCQKVVIAGEYDSHVCSPKTLKYKIVEMDYFVISKDTLGRDNILVKTMDGTLYTLIKRDKRESDKQLFSLPPPGDGLSG
jgi:hypothetical protein